MNPDPTTLRPDTSRPAGANPWRIRFGAPDAARRLRLYCFSYAGGSATIYQPWRALLDAQIEL